MTRSKEEDSYIRIMQESLKKKTGILEKLKALSQDQETALKSEKPDFTAFDTFMDEKTPLIKELTKLDDGFEALYSRVAESLKIEPESHREQIAFMQDEIKKITALSMDIRAIEARNKELFASKTTFERRRIRSSKTANRVAAGYYQNMSKLNVVESQFLDSKG